MLKVNLEEANDRLIVLINAAMQGEQVLIVKNNQTVAQLVPVAPVTHRQFGSAQGLVVMRDDFDTPLADFDAYTP